MTMATPPLDLQGLRHLRTTFALGPISATFAPGKCTAVIGPSGSGKTTLLRCIAGLEEPTAGTIAIGGRIVCGQGKPVPPNQRGVGLMFQDAALWPHMTALQHLRFAAPGMTVDAGMTLLAQGGIAHLAHRKPEGWSGGEAQRLALLRAIAPKPRLLLLDEPLRSIDVHRRADLVLLLHRMCRDYELTTVLVTHDREEALAMAQDVIVLHEGRIVERGPAAALAQAPRTAFTASFLGGGSCLPVHRQAHGALETPLGSWPTPANCARGELLLAVLPGDLRAAAAAQPGAVRGVVTSCVPGPSHWTLGVAVADHWLPAIADAALPIGADAALHWSKPPRFLPRSPLEDLV